MIVEGREDKGVGIKHFECSIDNSNFSRHVVAL